jgi:branched-chain amino acid transport system permease protein
MLSKMLRWLRTDPTGFALRAGGAMLLLLLLVRVAHVMSVKAYPLSFWQQQIANGLVVGGVYALVALGYTLVYGILFMINFAHGEVMMLGSYAGFFVLDAMGRSGLMDSRPVLAVLLPLAAGCVASMCVGWALERIAYRPLRTAPRLVPLITAIGASIFLQNTALLVFGSQLRNYDKPSVLEGQVGILAGKLPMTRTGGLVLVVAILLMLGLHVLIGKTKIGRAMRAVAEDKSTAALMGIDVDRVIVTTFLIGSFLAGAAGVLWGFHNRSIQHTVGFVPGLKAFTAAVLGGIGNVPGAMLGGFFLGLAEAVGPAALDISTQLKDVVAFSLLVLLLIFRPTGLLGEIVSGKRA